MRFGWYVKPQSSEGSGREQIERVHGPPDCRISDMIGMLNVSRGNFFIQHVVWTLLLSSSLCNLWVQHTYISVIYNVHLSCQWKPPEAVCDCLEEQPSFTGKNTWSGVTYYFIKSSRSAVVENRLLTLAALLGHILEIIWDLFCSAL